MQIGKSSYADVYEIDQASELMLLLSNGVYSYSLLENNDLLKIKYTFNDINGRNDLIIESIDVVSTKNGKVRSYNPFWIKIYHEHISTQL